MKKYLLFDLDGTLTDPKVGITTCVQYALQSFGIEEPDLDKLEPFIGPPLKESFMSFYQMDEEQAEAAVAKYRERFQEVGLFENEIYDGIPKLLKTLQAKGMILAVASSKPTVFVERILEHFDIAKYFTVVMGSELDGTRVSKDEVITEALKRLFGEKPILKDEIYMIGDRKFDVEGAKALKVESVAVAYGYGTMEELKAAKADYIVRSVEELEDFLLRETREQEPKKGLSFKRVWVVLYAFLIFMLLRSAILYGLDGLLKLNSASFTGALGAFLFLRDESGTVIGYTGNTMAILNAIGFIGGIIPSLTTAKLLIERAAREARLNHLKKEPVRNYLLLGTATVSAVWGLNILFELLKLTQAQDYQAARQNAAGAGLLVGIITYGLITPVVEELLFRGIIYNYIKRLIPLRNAFILSTVFFGAYHMNSVQGIYGFLMGCLITYAYEYFGSFKIPVILHIVNNVLALCMNYDGLPVEHLINWPFCIIFLALAAVSVGLLRKQKRVF